LAGRPRLRRRFIPEKTSDKSFRKQMDVADRSLESRHHQANGNVPLTEERKMKYYLCKYIPPRADFLATMTADEKKWMKQHGAFLDDLLNKGQIVAHGPVMDPNGGYGVSLYQIADDQDIAAITFGRPYRKERRRPLRASSDASFEGARLTPPKN